MAGRSVRFDDAIAEEVGLEDQLGSLTLLTENITLISHTHGKLRRSERGIARLELQAARK